MGAALKGKNSYMTVNPAAEPIFPRMENTIVMGAALKGTNSYTTVKPAVERI